jgi:UDP-N-acetyl-D-glucosamine dehydrogenase
MKSLVDKILKKETKIGIIGLGYVGLPLVRRFCEERFKVVGFDIDKSKVQILNGGGSYIKHIPSERIASLVQQGIFEATEDFNRLSEIDCIIICVPTPVTAKHEPDLSFVESTAEQISSRIRKGQLISLESTTYPGTTEELLLPRFRRSGLEVGKDFFLVFSPEREDPGNLHFSTKTIPKVVGGVTSSCLEAGRVLYEQVVDKVVTVSSTRVAEFTKLLENVYRGVNIALVNELKMIADRMGIDIWEVIEAAKTKPFGFTPFYPGPGMGGHCIPVDPFYLAWKAREFDFTTRFIELAGEINTSMPYYVMSKVTDALNSRGKSLKESKILILGVSYKKDIDDMRESPALAIIETLQQKGARVFYNDPHIPHISKLRKYDIQLTSSELNETLLSLVDVVLIVTDHSSYNFEWIIKHSQLVVDTRNATCNLKDWKDKILKA